MNQREQLSIFELGAELNTNSKALSGKLAKEVAEGLFQSTTDMLKSAVQTAGGFLEIMIDPAYSSSVGINHIEEKIKGGRSGERKVKVTV